MKPQTQFDVPAPLSVNLSPKDPLPNMAYPFQIQMQIQSKYSKYSHRLYLETLKVFFVVLKTKLN